MIPGTISSGLVQKPSSSTSFVPPSRNDWDLLFQPLFDELLNPPPSVDNQDAEVIAPIAEVIPPVDDASTGSPSSTAVDQYAPSPSKSLTPTEIQSLIILQDVGNDNLDIEVAHMGNDLLLSVPVPEVASGQSSSMASTQTNVQPNHPMTYSNSKWTKDHPLNYIIGPLSRPVSTRLQLHEQALFCYYDAFLTSVEPKTYKEAENGIIELYFVRTEYQLADMFTKALPEDRFKYLVKRIDIQSKEATLQVVYDVLRNSPLFRAFQVTVDVPEIYMQEFWATAKLHHHSIRFKIDTKKSVLDLEAFREMLHISPRIPNQPFADLPTEEEVLDFLRFLGHSHDIHYLTDVNVNKLYQPWRSFASVINKCLTGKSSGVDSFRLSQAQMLWGFYHRITIDFAYLIWEDFVYQVEHKSQKKSNEMNYPRFTKVIIDYFITRKPSISR
nr:monodehydroascorbate reductase [Tanacetum cinerariifolium]